MKLVLLSGGSGQRLWPLSNDSRSKQFLKVLSDTNGESQSMVQRVWKQLERKGLDKDCVVATSKSQVEMIKNQIGEQVDIVVEPERRDTFPAIALSTLYLYSELGISKDEVIIMLPVDPFVDDKFFDCVNSLENLLNTSDSELGLIGVVPTLPSSKYGYIVPEINNNENHIKVKGFKEKPDEETAEKLIAQGALWNCGVFAFRIGYLIDILVKNNLPTSYDKLLASYNSLSKTSFDYEVVENANKISAIEYSGDWKDLGTWNTLTEEMADNLIGRGIISSNSTETHVINELDIPVTVIDIQDAVIAVSSDGILVTSKDSSPKVKDYVKNFKGRPMYEERRWGWYRVLDYTKYTEGNEVLTKRICIKQGKNLSYQLHYKRSEVWTIVKGEGILILNDEHKHIRSGDVINIPLGHRHAIKATTDLEIIEVQTGSDLNEIDIVRFATKWNEIEGQIFSKI